MMRQLSFEITAPLPKLKAYIAYVRPYRVGYSCRRASLRTARGFQLARGL